jgi:EAL domain-containing protein (putative c-di-GMP-specific phosphodiesterase class I)/FixJ family two-component response regulator
MSALRILIVDDDRQVGLVASRALEELATCDVAGDIAAAERALERESYDVVLIDLTLPDGSGMTLLDELRSNWPHSVPVMLSGVSDLSVAGEALSKGALGYVVKPFRVRDLRIQVAAALAIARRPANASRGSARARAISTLTTILAGREPLACVVVDLERLPLLGASFGADAIERLRQCIEDRLRNFDPCLQVLGHLGPSSFAAALALTTGRSPSQVAKELHRVLSAPVMHHAQRIPIASRLGVVVSSPGETAEAVLGLAEAAADSAHNRDLPFVVYEGALGDTTRLQFDLLADATTAIHRGDLHVAYQPQWNLITGECVGLEALARWRHPTRGDISPAVFVPLAERMDLIADLGAFVLRRACIEVAQLRRARKGRPLRVSVNVSALELSNEHYPRTVAVALAEAGLPASSLRLEVTETIALTESDELHKVMRDLQELGVQLSVDDFGTGYSSFDNLARIAWAEIKLDRCITVQSGNVRGRAMMRSIVSLGNALGIDVIAEGIETVDELTTLRALGCRYGQGFLMARPQSITEVAILLATETNSTTAIRVASPA